MGLEELDFLSTGIGAAVVTVVVAVYKLLKTIFAKKGEK